MKKMMMMKLLFPKSHVLIEQNQLSRLLPVDIQYRTNIPAILHFITEFNLINYTNSFHFIFNQMETKTTMTGGDSSNKGCFGRKTNLFRESEDFAGNRETWEIFGEI